MSAPNAFFDAYVITALWSSTDTDGVPLARDHDRSDIAPETLERMRADCDAFYDANEAALNCNGVTYGSHFSQDGRAGHDFWLTRCGHGAGFWDGDWPEPPSSQLTAAAQAFGNVDLYVGDDGKIYA